MLQDYEAPALDQGIEEALTDFIARKKDSAEDAFAPKDPKKDAMSRSMKVRSTAMRESFGLKDGKEK